MVTPVGLDAHESCASLRAGINLMQGLEYFLVESDWFEENPLVGCRITGLTDGMLGLGRWTRMAARAIEDLVTNAKLSPDDLAASRLYLALPPLDRPGLDQRIGTWLGRRLAEWLQAPRLEAATRVYPDGHAATLKATCEATQELLGRKASRAIVGGVDSLIEPDTLAHFLAKKRLKTEDHVDGFVPGEAAAFFSLESAENARARGAKPLAILEAPSIAQERNTIWSDEPPAAVGLCETIEMTFEQVAEHGMDTGLVVCDLNGETYRAREFGVAVPRVFSQLKQQWRLWHPADCIGDTGAASAAVSVCVAARAFQRGYARTNRALVFGGSDEGLRGAASVRAPM